MGKHYVSFTNFFLSDIQFPDSTQNLLRLGSTVRPQYMPSDKTIIPDGGETGHQAASFDLR
jgi:hypothetical protein